MPKPGPAPEINLDEPQQFTLFNGLKVLVVENHKLPRVSIQLSIDNPPILEGDKAGVSSLAGSLLGQGSTTISKDDFNEEIDFLGARLDFGAQSAYASSLSKYFPRMMELLADAAINPNFTQEEFDKEKEKLLTALKTQEKDVAVIAERVQRILAYGKDHPYGEYTTPETVENVTLADVEEYYRDYFVPENAYLVVMGDVDFDAVKMLTEKYFSSWKKAVPLSFSFSDPSNALFTQIDFVDMPNAVQSEIAVQNIEHLKMKDDDYLAALMANQILGGGPDGRLYKNLREDKGYTYGSYSFIGDNKYTVARFVASASVRNMVTDSAIVQMLEEVDRIINIPVTEEELSISKAKYAGKFVMTLEKPQTIAGYALNIEKEGLPKDFYKTYLERLEKVTIADVQKAAKKYFSTENARVVVVGKGSDVLQNLEKLTFKGKQIPVRYFDKHGEKTDKPDYSMVAPEGVTPQMVIENYLKAIGGRDKLNSVSSYLLVAEAEMQGMKLGLEVKKTGQGQFMQDVTMMGSSMSKQVLNGDSGYMVMQGQRKDFSPEEVIMVKEEATLFPELNYLDTKDIALEGNEMVDDRNAYKLKITPTKTVFYDVENGFKIQELNVMEMQGRQVRQTVKLSDYRAVDGIMFPFKINQTMGPQSFEFMVTEIKVNEGVSPSDFE